MFNSVKYIEGIVESMTFNEPIVRMQYFPSKKETFIELCKTYWCFPCYKVVIGGTEYEIKDFEVNMSISIKGEVTGTPTEVVIPAPHFIHGTPLQASGALNLDSGWRDQLPFIYLIEPMTEQRDKSLDSILDRTSMFNGLFMLPGDNAEDVHHQYKNAIHPTENMVEEFENKIQNDPMIVASKLKTATTRNRVHYGVWVRKTTKQQGPQKPKKSKEDNIVKLIDSDISGIDYALGIPFSRSVRNETCNKCH